MSVREEGRDRLGAFGFGDEEIKALELLWEHDEIGPLLGRTANEFRLMGWHLADAYDAAFHELDPDDAMVYFRRGFTGHQAHIIDTHPQAETNLWGNRSEADLDTIFDSDIPRDVLINVLLAAQDSEDTNTYLRRYQAAATEAPETHGPRPDTTASIAAEAAMLAELNANQSRCCS